MRTAAYIEDLRGYSRDVLAVALRDARANAQTFCPSIKDIRDAAGRELRRRQQAIDYSTPTPQLPPPPRIAPERIDELLAPLRKRWGIAPGEPLKAAARPETGFSLKRKEQDDMWDRWCADRGLNPNGPKSA